MLSSHPKTSDVIDMVGVPNWRHVTGRFLLGICHIVSASSADLTCFAIENILLLPHLKQVYNGFSRVSCGFSSCFIKRFIFSLAQPKTGCSKIGSILVSTLFSLYLKINMEHHKKLQKTRTQNVMM